MWRFLTGCELPPPLPKQVKSKEDVSESTKSYKKIKRQQERTQLVFCYNVMFCLVCIEAVVDATVGHKNSFNSGNCQFKLLVESIKLHKELHNHNQPKLL